MKKIILFILIMLLNCNAFTMVVWGARATIPIASNPICAKELYVKVVWNANVETNNDYFEIQRSTDGENYTKIDEMDGCGTCALKTYVYIDAGPFFANTTYYYRVRAVSKWGLKSTRKAGEVTFFNSETDDWKSQVTNTVKIASTSANPDDYVWQEETKTFRELISI